MNNSAKSDKTGQLVLSMLHSEIHKTSTDGIEMGVLENGMPYLSQRGIVKMTGIARSPFQRLSTNWKSDKTSGIGFEINKLLTSSGYTEDELFIEVEVNGRKTYAYTEPVCLALLEYYAFDAKKKSEVAQNSYRILSKAGFRVFVYQYTGYKPQHEQLDSWKHFHDRIDLVYNEVPKGYYCIFREIAGMIVSLIRQNILVNDKIIPDISVGQHWSKYWNASDLNVKFGNRLEYSHNYPDYYPQSKSNPQSAKAYPNESLHIFRQWFEETYLISKFPKYILNQSKQGKIELSIANKVIESVSLPMLDKKA